MNLTHEQLAPFRRALADRGVHVGDETCRELLAVALSAAIGEPARSFAEWSSSWINAHGYPPAAHEVYAALAAQSQAGREQVPFADGENPCVLEWGAVSLPMGDPSRITEMKLCPTLWAAIAEGALCGFDWRVYPMALSPKRAAEGGANG